MESNLKAVRWALQYGADPNYANVSGLIVLTTILNSIGS